MSFTATVKKEKLKEFFDRKGVVASALFKILPDETELLCEAEMRYDAKSSSVYAKISSLHLNGISVPPKLLSEFGEIELDFKRSLVYN